MPKLKPLKRAHEDLDESLLEWGRTKIMFRDDNPWQKGRFSPFNIIRRIGEAADSIHMNVRFFSGAPDVNLWRDMRESIWSSSTEMSEAVKDGTYDTLNHGEDVMVDAMEFESWQAVCGSVESFARSAAKELADSWSKYLWSKHFADSDRSLFNAVYSSLCILEETADVALRYRKRGIKGCLEGPLSEYAREDANLLGL
jgi:hypothetical protein